MRRWRADEAPGGRIKCSGQAADEARSADGIDAGADSVGSEERRATDQSVEIRLRAERTVIVSASLDCGLLSRLIGAVERAA